jgi:hypothetical protein
MWGQSAGVAANSMLKEVPSEFSTDVHYIPEFNALPTPLGPVQQTNQDNKQP